MADEKDRRWLLITLALFLVLIVGGFIGFQVAVRILKGKVVESLGPDSEIKDIQVGWSGVVVEGLRLKGPSEWPAADTLRAERVTLVPSLCSIFSGQYRVRSIAIVKPYLSALRTRDGKLLVVPSLLAGKGKSGTPSKPASPPTVTIGRISLQDGVVELFDATVARPPLKIRLEQIQADVRDLVIPALKGRSRFELTGMVKGVNRDGRAEFAGWAEIATKDSSVKVQLRSVDLVALQPYLSKANETKVQKGILDLDLQSDVRNNRMKAPGKITISDLKLAPAKGTWGTFMGVPRDAVVALLEIKGNKITLNFILEGDINNPRFSLNEALTMRLALSMAEALNVNLGGVAKGAGALGQKSVEAAGEVAKGVGSTVQHFFGGQKKGR